MSSSSIPPGCETAKTSQEKIVETTCDHAGDITFRRAKSLVFAILSEFQHGRRFTPIVTPAAKPEPKRFRRSRRSSSALTWILSRKPVEQIA